MAATQDSTHKAEMSLPTKALNDGVRKKSSGITKGRPPLSAKPQAALSSQRTRQLIRSHHNLNKELAKELAQGNDAEADELKKRIADLGGLKSYQIASTQGQANDRGGDSSIVLMEWLKPVARFLAGQKSKPRLLEVGALSTKNACSKSGLLDIQRIDLFSQTDGIIQQDFMERPVPTQDSDKFDIISLSLVLNFVPDAEGRGEMLKRTCQFLDTRATRTSSKELQAIYPALFLVLPTACIINSRYMSEQRLTCIMASLGYVLLRVKQTAKLVYYLWQLRDKPVPDEQNFTKKQTNPGGGKNNFSIMLHH
ncbi:hypothetical protein LTR36_008436 [Oleoguttula mirabilis]|uniref:25S rRNA adenine-N(1) methyltransferase n=1 Tax=Oleoguttula mirabilis TaxID=1507867 RepID=A0AAV9J7H4_9PEZI|nr:hypothetical protein LTR36_008436 [Oleoguttula mirabilis]